MSPPLQQGSGHHPPSLPFLRNWTIGEQYREAGVPLVGPPRRPRILPTPTPWGVIGRDPPQAGGCYYYSQEKAGGCNKQSLRVKGGDRLSSSSWVCQWRPSIGAPQVPSGGGRRVSYNWSHIYEPSLCAHAVPCSPVYEMSSAIAKRWPLVDAQRFPNDNAVLG